MQVLQVSGKKRENEKNVSVSELIGQQLEHTRTRTQDDGASVSVVTLGSGSAHTTTCCSCSSSAASFLAASRGEEDDELAPRSTLWPVNWTERAGQRANLES